MQHDLDALLSKVLPIVEKAADTAFNHYTKKTTISTTQKKDGTLLTKVDKEIDDFICAGLSRLTPSIEIVSEEGENTIVNALDEFWLVDPIDGTRGFVEGSDEFCINIALVRSGKPVLALIYVPVKKHYFAATANHSGGYFHSDVSSTLLVTEKAKSLGQLCLIAGRNRPSDDMLKAYLSTLYPFNQVKRMHSAIKFTQICLGLADAYIRLGPTSLWDVAAGQLLVEKAGGVVVDFHGKTLQYRPESGLINPPFIVLGNSALLPDLLELCHHIRGEHEKRN
jgi:3'(2'), 5'-bisphosphate nucleotidase